ncbi:MAG: carboxypeptidase regulatory-like domain-containing protein [Planctomycetes bacterium]|nr:carboxypeptidase regulatory-like domain-containing protein [Planctomycetota bacterium]
MPRQSLVLLVAALLLLVTGGVLLPGLFRDDATAPLQWSQHEELEVDAPIDAAASEADPVVERVELEAAAAGATAADLRVEVLLRGRVVDRFGAPQPKARVWLDFGRGGPRGQNGRQRRVPDPVETDGDGRFAFQGQTFRSLRVSLQVLHGAFAPGLFDRDVGQVQAEVDLGDLVLERGGEVVGRVTDLDGNGIPGATVELSPENGNAMRFLRDRDKLLASVTTDNNGYYRRPNVAAGDWSARATAPRHVEGRTDVFAVENERPVDVEDIRLGPGYELGGIVRAADGRPVAQASVALRGQRTAGRRGGGGGGGGHDTKTDAQGRFVLDHLPGTAMQLEVRADGFLTYTQADVDPKLGQPIQVTLQDGLRLSGIVVDEDGTPVTRFALRAVRVRGLPTPGAEPVDAAALFERLRSGNLADAERGAIRAQLEQLRFDGEDGRRMRPGGGGDGGGDDRDLGRFDDHPDGRFVAAGLQEGVYELLVQSPDHARLRSAEVELRLGFAAPDLRLQLDRGVYLAGIVRDAHDRPVASARVSLRLPTPARRPRGTDETTTGGRDRAAAAVRDIARQFADASRNLETETNADGEFVLKHVPRGSYRLQASADGHASATVEPLELDADRSGVQLVLGMLGAVTGRVFGLVDGEQTEARVAAVPTTFGGDAGPGMFRGRGQGGGGGPFRTGSIAADGTYRIEGLTPGDYIVRAWIGSPQELMRELGPKLFDGTLAADVTVRGGDEQRLDVELQRTLVGAVAGTVLHNGSPGQGLFVELSRIGETADDERGGMFGRMMRGGRTQNATVAASGNFRIDNVPVGTWRLRVHQSRRRGLLHEEVIAVSANTATERHLSLTSVRVVGSVDTGAGGDAAALRGRAELLPGLTELPANLNEWRRDNPTGHTTEVAAGAFTFDGVAPGSYLLVLQLAGRERTAQPVVVDGAETRVQIAAGPVQATPTNAPTPGARPGQPR